jgi:hypothetical protein
LINAPEYDGSKLYLNMILERDSNTWDFSELKVAIVEFFKANLEFSIKGVS